MTTHIKDIIEKLIKADATPSINYAVINNNDVTIGSLGNKSKYKLENNELVEVEEKNNINTIYDLASLTKIICTLTIIFRLKEAGKLALEDKVQKYLPDFKYDDITIYDLLTHTSGLEADFKSKEIISKEEVLKRLYDSNKGSKEFLYSDIGYMFLGLVIESICKKSLDEVFKEEVAVPLEMNNTTFNPKDKNSAAATEVTKTRGVIRGVVHDEKAYSMGGVAGHAGLFSNISDLIKYVTMIVNGGVYNNKEYLSKNTIDEWFNPIIESKGYKRSYTWYVGDNPNVIFGDGVISFNGFTGPSISIDRKNDIAIIMLTNRIHPSRENRLITDLRPAISKEIYDFFNKKTLKNTNDDFDYNIKAFNCYVEECRRKIKKTFFNENELDRYKALRTNLINAGKISEDSSLEQAIKFERLQMIDIKVDHTMRVVEDVLRVAQKIGTPIDFNNVLKMAALLHDIGRFDQATWNDSFNDSCYKNDPNIKNHGQAGNHILFQEGLIKKFKIDKEFHPAIGKVVYHHVDPVLNDDLSIKFTNPSQLDVSKLTGLETLNDSEKIIVSALVQMVKDVDMLDIFYQLALDTSPVIRKFINYKVENDSILEIARYWGIDAQDILDYNGIKEENISNLETIKIPVSKLDPRKLEVPSDIKQRFFNNEHIDLRELNQRRDWVFITGMWWRLNHFLNNINFTSNLEMLKESNLLDRIYNMYPDEYKFLVKDAFDFAKENLIKRVLESNNSEIYIHRKNR